MKFLLPPFIYTLTCSALNFNRFHIPNHQEQQQNVLSTPLQSPGFIALGDSYSAGIGTTSPGEEENPCRQGSGAYPYLIHSDLLLSSTFQWLSCTGSTTGDVLDPNAGQIDSVNTSIPATFATLSIGGNDVGFFDVINACVFRFYAFYSGGCEGVLSKAEGLVRDAIGKVGLGVDGQDGDNDDGKNEEARLIVHRLRLVVLEMLDKIRWEVNGDFTILVTGYAAFFNDQTERCDNVSLAVWWDGVLDYPSFAGGNGSSAYRPKLTREVRGRMNGLVRGVNGLLRGVVEGINRRFGEGRRRVVFVDYDDLFEGHRFCEEGVEEPDYKRGGTWFFLPGGEDGGSPEEEEVGKEMLLGGEDTRLVDPVGCLEVVEKSGDWGERALCYMAMAKARNPQLVLSPQLVPSTAEDTGKITKKDSMWYVPTYYGKTFHPRSLGHQVIRDRLYDVWEEEVGFGG